MLGWESKSRGKRLALPMRVMVPTANGEVVLAPQHEKRRPNVDGSNIANEMNGSSQDALDYDLHPDANHMPEPDKIEQYREMTITDIATQARLANT